MVGLTHILNSCSSSSKEKTLLPPMLEKAPEGKLLKAGVIGCGGRGTGAAINFLNAGPGTEITALADVFQDRLDTCQENLKKAKGIEIEDENCFTGFNAFRQLLETDVDVVILATPPHFRPEHFEACVQAQKHVFMEKPVAVDPVGVRKVMIAGKKAEQLGLTVVAGTVKRHQKDFIDIYKRVNNGAIGDIVSANSYYNVGKLWNRKPKAEWSEMEAMIRDWVNWCWLSGDHIVEQHLHNLDVANWFIGKHPQQALGFGGRHRRETGDQFDFFSVDYVYDNDVHVHSMSRQINACDNRVGDVIRGTKGYANPENTIYHPDGTIKYSYDYPLDQNGVKMKSMLMQAYDQEHINLVTSIRKNMAFNETQNVAEATMTAIMGRLSAYTGKSVSWDEMMNSDLHLGPKHYAFGTVNIPKQIPKPGID
ncbi:MAG: Gfo/Idh/MocA family oxidoreductase [Bacteroidales bacterium]|nr:Gfo/Idh/MocA family oxidoreductase [Bacteroidales bacterium]